MKLPLGVLNQPKRQQQQQQIMITWKEIKRNYSFENDNGAEGDLSIRTEKEERMNEEKAAAVIDLFVCLFV